MESDFLLIVASNIVDLPIAIFTTSLSLTVVLPKQSRQLKTSLVIKATSSLPLLFALLLVQSYARGYVGTF